MASTSSPAPMKARVMVTQRLMAVGASLESTTTTKTWPTPGSTGHKSPVGIKVMKQTALLKQGPMGAHQMKAAEWETNMNRKVGL